MSFSNGINNNNNLEKKYFDKRDEKEEMPCEINPAIQTRCEKIEKLIYDDYYKKDSIEIAKKLSMSERAKMGIKDDDNYVYGEITFRSFAYIFESIKHTFGNDGINQGLFYDLGSGAGKGCLSASLLHPFNKCYGIEYLDNLHKMSLKTEIKYKLNFKKQLLANPHLFPNHKYAPEIEFTKGDFFERDWSYGSFVFSNSTTFSKKAMDELFVRANELKKGSIFVNTTQNMPKKYLNKWERIKPFQRLMSWGLCTVYIYKKK
jgi:hypothetical protein